MTALTLRNRQRLHPIDLGFFREIIHCLLKEKLAISEFQLGVYLVSPVEITRLNETFLSHSGSTDVISFHYPDAGHVLRGEIFISVGDAIQQAKEYRTNWQSEVIRYLVHGLLHLEGYDDRTPATRRVMKRHENRLLDEISRDFSLRRLGRKPMKR